MSAGGYLAGVASVAAALAALALGALALRRLLAPGWRGAPARLAELVLAHALLIVVAQALGTAGLLARWPLLAGLWLAAAAALWRSRRRAPAGAAGVPPAPRVPRLAAVIAGALACVVAATWIRRALTSLDLGIGGVDSLWYHLPFAARFAQDGDTTGLHFTDVEFLTAFYPANVELVHAVAIVLFGSDALSTVLNLGWLALAFLAAWCLGRPFDAAPAALAGAAVALSVPTLVLSQAGEAKNDVAAVALLVSAAAVLANAGRAAPAGARGDEPVAGREEPGARAWPLAFPPPAALALAGLAAGFAVGARVNFAAPVAGLTVALVWLAPSAVRVRAGATWLAALLVSGGYWYARNLLTVGNPLPAADLGPLPRPEGAPLERTGRAVADYATDPAIWSDWFLPGLESALGPAWWGVLAAMAAGLALALARPPSRAVRAVAAAGAVAALAYLVTPQTAAGPEGRPFGFAINVRYLAPALVLGLALLGTAPALRAPRRAALLCASLALLGLVALTAPDLWAAEHRWDALGAGVLLAAGAAAAALLPRPAALAGAALAALVLVAGGHGAVSQYERQAYTTTLLPYTSWQAFALQPVYTWARELEDARIALGGTSVGFFQYPLHGRELENRVQYVGERGRHGSYEPVESCAEWRRALAAGDYDYVVAGPDIDPWNPFAPTPAQEVEWTRTDPGARELVAADGRVFAFALERPPDPEACPA